MYGYIGTIDNFTILPTPVLDETAAEGYRIEQRLQVTIKAASNEQAQTVEFRLGDESQAPAEQQLVSWLESGEIVIAYCTGLNARPFVHQEGKTYRSKGREVQIGEVTAALDAFVVLAGVSMAPLSGGPALEDVVRQVRAAYKRSQRDYRQRRNAERVKQLEAQLPERVRAMQERRVTQAAQAVEASTAAADAPASNGRKR
jgi:hypothetical protein